MDGYTCMEDRNKFMVMLWWETAFTGLFFGLVVLHYYKNVLVIKSRFDSRSSSAMDSRQESMLKENPMSSDLELSSRLLDDKPQK